MEEWRGGGEKKKSDEAQKIGGAYQGDRIKRMERKVAERTYAHSITCDMLRLSKRIDCWFPYYSGKARFEKYN